jgi:SAM-dependent methyltransferase
MVQYQDIWVKGECIKRGVRECEDRYKIIHDFCSQYSRPFTVLDIGANLGYFSLRLAEDFNCTCVAIEKDYNSWLLEVLIRNQNPRVIFLDQKITYGHLWRLSACEHFDVILCMSVIHHFEDPFSKSLDIIRQLGDHVILEVPYETRACGQHVVRDISIPIDAKLIGEGKSHLDDGHRKIYHLENPQKILTRRHMTAHTELLSGSLRVISNFFKKKTKFEKKNDSRDWYRGINLYNYLYMHGRYPGPSAITKMLQELDLDPPHRDIESWNIILQGDAVQLIDYNDPNHTVYTDDKEQIAKIVSML